MLLQSDARSWVKDERDDEQVDQGERTFSTAGM